MTRIPSIVAVTSSRFMTIELCPDLAGLSSLVLGAADLLVLLATVDVGFTATDLRLVDGALLPVISLIFAGSAFPSIFSGPEILFAISDAFWTICRARRMSRNESRKTKGSMSTVTLVRDDDPPWERLSIDIVTEKSSRIRKRLVSNLSIRHRNIPTLVICSVEAFCWETSTCFVPSTIASELDIVGFAIKITCASTMLTRNDMVMELSLTGSFCCFPGKPWPSPSIGVLIPLSVSLTRRASAGASSI